MAGLGIVLSLAALPAAARAASYFSSAPSMPAALLGAGVAALPDGNVLIAGGYDGTNRLSSAYVFNPSSGTS